MPERPKGLKALGRRVWDKWATELSAAGVWRPVDEFKLKALCLDLEEATDLREGKFGVVRERERQETARRRRLRQVLEEIRQTPPEDLAVIATLKAEAAVLEGQRPEGSAQVLLAMQQEGRSVSAVVGALHNRIARSEAFFRRRIDAANADGAGSDMLPATAAQPDTVESLIQ